MKSFAARAFRVTFDDAGLSAVTASAPSGRVYLDRLEIGSLRRDGELVSGETGPPMVDTDEVEQLWLASGVASIEVRHSFLVTWRTRVVLSNLAGVDWTATLRFAVRPGPGHRVWTLASGSASALALLPRIRARRSSTPAAAPHRP